VRLVGQIDCILFSYLPASFSSDMQERFEDCWKVVIDLLFHGTPSERKVFYFIYHSSRADEEEV